MEELPLVSIVCTTYNHGAYIKQALEGFVCQQTNFSFEIIVHDDASTDNTPLIIKEYEIKYPNLFRNIYRTENWYSQGKDIWRYLFKNKVRGKYIALCEGDDYWIDPLKLQKQVVFLEDNHDYTMCFHNAIVYKEEIPDVSLFNLMKSDEDLSIHDAIHKWLIPTASIVIRNDVVSNYPQWMPQIYSGDYSMILLARHLGKVRYQANISSVYRLNFSSSSLSSQMKNKNILMLEQKILLLKGFNIGTKYQYNGEVEYRILYLMNELAFQKLKKRKLMLLFHPRVLSWKLVSKMKIMLEKYM